MLKSRIAILSLVFSPLVAGCGSSLTVEVRSEGAEGTPPVAKLALEFIPYDRDSLFAVLSASADSPEPQIPDDVRTQLDSVNVLQAAWRDVEGRWGEAREELRQLAERLEAMNPRDRAYRQLFDQFNALEGRERSLDRQRLAGFDAFTGLQEATAARLDSVRAVIEVWENVAFRDYVDIEAALLGALGREIIQDTTDAMGLVTRKLPRGDWWVHARVAVPAGELYWNLLVGGVDTLRLNPDNAQHRLAF